MRATRSDDTILDGAFVPDKYIARVVPAGFAGADLFVLGIFAWAEPTFANIYLGIARAGAAISPSPGWRRSGPRSRSAARRWRTTPSPARGRRDGAGDRGRGAARRADRATTGRTAWTTVGCGR